MKKADITSLKFNRLTAVKYIGRDNHKKSIWECVCDCGKFKHVSVGALRKGNTKSCGCLNLERTGSMNRTHGGSRTPEYRNWCAMKERCHSPSHKNYSDYGGRGIQVCERWLNSFENFLADMGPRPFPKATVERIDSDRGYSPDNCRWATQKEQTRNKRNTVFLEFNGERKSVGEWAEKLGLKISTITSRLRRGFCVEDALSLRHLV